MINRKIQISAQALTVNGMKPIDLHPDMSIRKVGMNLYCTYTNGGTAVTNSALKALGMWKVIVKINGVIYHEYESTEIQRINESRGYVPESTDCNAIGASTAGTAYAVFELPVSIVKTADVKTVTFEITHTTTGAGSTNAGTVTVPYADITIFYDDTVPFTNKFVRKQIPSGTSLEDSPPVDGLLDMITIYGASDYITQVYLVQNGVNVVDMATFKSYVRERTLRLQGTRVAYGESIDVDNIPVETTTKLKITNSTAQAVEVGYLLIAEIDTDVFEDITAKALSNLEKVTVPCPATELEDEARIAGVDIPIIYPDHPFGEISM